MGRRTPHMMDLLKSKVPCFVWNQKHASFFGILMYSISAWLARRNSRQWPALVVWALLLAGSCLFAGGGRPGERSGGLQQAGSAGAGNSPNQEQAAPATAEDFLKKGNEYARLNKWKEAEEAYRKAMSLRPDFHPRTLVSCRFEDPQDDQFADGLAYRDGANRGSVCFGGFPNAYSRTEFAVANALQNPVADLLPERTALHVSF
jgi:tetratricopeptide (TPR) repeat protein